MNRWRSHPAASVGFLVQSELRTGIKPVKWGGTNHISDAINQAWDATNEASDGTTDAWDGVNQASDEATEAWDAINEASVITNQAWDGTNDAWDAINQAWVMTNEAWDEANQASVIAGKPQQVAKNAFFIGFGGSNGQNETVLVRDGRAVEEIGERRVGKECLRLCRSRWSPDH